VRLLGLDGSALARLDVHGEVFVPSSDLGHPHPPARWVAGRGLSRYRSGFAVAPEIGALSLAVRPGADVRFGPEPIPGHGRAPLDVVVTLTGAQTSPDARVRVLADGRVVAELDPPDARDRSWQSPPARVELGSDVVRFSLEMVDGAPDDVAWVRDIALFAVPR
jgi:hypothetical protein